MKTGSLCSGYAGLDRAVHEVLGGELAWVADNDPDASKVLACRFPLVPNLGDITGVDWSAVEPVEILTAGFPCQDISCAGKRAGLREGTRSGIWSHVARAIAALRPPLVVIENVKELLSERADSDVESCPWCLGDTSAESAMRALGAVLADLAEIGFDAEWVSVPASSAGACHLRWRVFILAWPAADAGSPRRREVAGGASRDEGDAGRPAGSAGDADARRPGLRTPAAGRGTDPASDAEGIGEREPADAAEPIPGSRRARAVPGCGSDGPAAGSAGIGRQRHHEPPPVDPDGQSRPGPRPGDRLAPADPERGGRGGRPQEPQRGPEWGVAATWHRPGAFGRYEAAVRRHERAFGRLVPAPVAPGKNGDPRLSPAFSEWMMGLPAGWVTDIPGLSRTARLKVIGNGVVPAQAAMALRLLLDRAEILPLVADRGAA
jgi:DNA (cytosine-5)-methyltransferase 1